MCPVAAQRDLADIPEPDPTAERAAMTVDPIADVNLFAKDPDLSKPIQINFDCTGGLWIASSNVYPQIQPGEDANDKIIVLRDTDGDGVADKRSVFADGLLIPTGVLPDGPNAAYVVDSTRLLYLQDTDGDGRADKQEVVLSGFGTEDTHHLVHTLRFGPDGCLYFNQSIYIHSHVDTPYGSRHLDGGGIWRYRPTTRELEVFCKGFVNPWGHVFDRVGESFATDGAFGEGINYVFPDSVFVASPGAERQLKGMNPGSPKHCGLEILSGTHIPEDWVGDFVTNDFRGHRVCRFKVKASGSSYVGQQQGEIITSSHVAFRPIDARMGPDGAIYLADWYNPIIQHGEVDFRDERRDRTHGRIWRVSFPGRPPDPWPPFESLSIDQLLNVLSDPALAIRQFARQELWKRGAESPHEVLQAYRRWHVHDKTNRTNELLWIHEALQQSVLQSGSNNATTIEQVAPEARRTVMRSVWRSRKLFNKPVADRVVSEVLKRTSDPDPRLRLEAVALAGTLSAAEYPQAIDAVLDALGQDIDFSLDFAIWQSLRKLDTTTQDGSALRAITQWNDRISELAHAVTAIKKPTAAEVALELVESGTVSPDAYRPLVDAIAIAGDGEQLGRLLRLVLFSQSIQPSAAWLQPLFDRTGRDKTLPANLESVFADFPLTPEQLAADTELVRLVARASELWKVRKFDDLIIEAATKADGSTQTPLINALGAIPSAAAQEALATLLRHDDPALRIAAAGAIANARPDESAVPVVTLLSDSTTSEAAGNLIIELMKRNAMHSRLADAIRAKPLTKEQAEPLLRLVKSSGGNNAIEDAIRSSARLEDVAWKLTPELKTDILSQVESSGSPQRGESIYRRESLKCIQCHAIGSAGGLVGPNLISVGGSSQPDYILESLLDPNAKLKEGYTTLNVLTDDGVILNGIVVNRTDEAIRLRLADGKEVQLSPDSIEQEQPGKSLMPEGSVDTLTKQELVDLVAFLSAVGRLPEFTVSTEPIVRSYETLVRSPKALHTLSVNSKDTVANPHPDLVWKSLTAKVNGEIPLEEVESLKIPLDAPNSYVRFAIDMPQDGVAKLNVTAKQFRAWADAKPTPPAQLGSMQLAKGRHTIVLAIDRDKTSEPVVVRIGGDAR